MASFDLHDKCARCRDKLIGKDDCVLDKPCSICDSFSDSQKDALATPVYRIRKDKKAGILVSPKDVTVDDEPAFQSPVCQSAQLSAQPSVSSFTSQASTNFVTSDQFMAMSDKWAEQFARMEALTRGNIFSTPLSSVKPVTSHQLISDTPFLGPSTRPTGRVEAQVALDAQVKPKPVDSKEKKTSQKSKKGEKAKDNSKDMKPDMKRDRSSSPPPKLATTNKQGRTTSPLAFSSSSPESVEQSSFALHSHHTTGMTDTTGSTGQVSSGAYPSGYEQSFGGACAYPPDPDDAPFDTEQFCDIEQSGTLSDSEDEQLSDSTERPEQTEDMSYRETVRSVRSFMGWDHIPTFDTDYST